MLVEILKLMLLDINIPRLVSLLFLLLSVFIRKQGRLALDLLIVEILLTTICQIELLCESLCRWISITGECYCGSHRPRIVLHIFVELLELFP